MADDEVVRAARLLDAQDRAARLFAEIDERGLVAPGEGERAKGEEYEADFGDFYEELLTLG
jgi:hypothetical protein